jgi:hypothetical protein
MNIIHGQVKIIQNMLIDIVFTGIVMNLAILIVMKNLWIRNGAD